VRDVGIPDFIIKSFWLCHGDLSQRGGILNRAD
jgi:hypothetical protein